MHPESSVGPDVLIVGRVDDETIAFAGGLMFRYARKLDGSEAEVSVAQRDRKWRVAIRPHGEAQVAPLL